jgi:predicted porin
MLASISWIWLFRQDGFLNLKYAFSNENAKGVNWQNKGHRFTANVACPLRKDLQLQVSAQAFLQDYDNVHTTFLVKREDRNYMGSVGLNWEFRKRTKLIVQYTRTRVNSNVGIYDYERDQLTAGIEYRF